MHATPVALIAATLREAEPGWLLLGVAFGLLTRFAAAERTLVISRALGLGVSRRQTVETLFISNYYSLLSPGPVLSGVVSVYRYRGYGASVTASMSTLLASRAIEAATFITLGAACLVADQRVALAPLRYPLLVAGAAVLLIAVCLIGWSLLHRRQSATAGGGHSMRSSQDGLRERLLAVWHDLVRQGPRMALQAAIPASAQVILSGAALCFLARALGVELTLLTSVWMSAAVYVVVLLPISVAGLGVRDLTLIRSLALLGVSAPVAVALSVLLLTDPLLNALIGGIWQMSATLGNSRKLRVTQPP